MKPIVKFHAHACIEIEHQGESLLCDPWFSGKVFNESWALLVSEPPTINYDTLKYIWISHEHPDHFHLPTLKQIAATATHPIKAIFQNQANKNVAEALRKMGYEIVELNDEETKELPNGLRLTSYRRGSDIALVVQSDGCTILNQNDCQLKPKVARRLAKRHGPIDLWLFQFSLAGHSGNYDDEPSLNAAREKHFNLIKTYNGIFNPGIFVPFASFVTFCRYNNGFLNKWAIRPDELMTTHDVHDRVQIVYNNDLILWDREGIKERNMVNARKWREAYKQPLMNDPAKPADPEELIKNGSRFCEKIRRTWPSLALPPTFYIRLNDMDQDAVVDFRSGRLTLMERSESPIVDIDSASLLFLIRFPWGADTIHISSCFYVRNVFMWKWFTYIRHGEYKLADRPKLYKFAPLVMAFVRTKLA